MIITGCLEHEDVPSLYVPYDETKGTKVVVSTIVPEIAESASEIAINGSGFSPGIDSNRVYFSSFEYDAPNDVWKLIEVQQAIVKSATENQLIIYRPGINGDSIQIKVVNLNADEYGQYNKNYPIGNIFQKHGTINPTDVVRAMGVDADDNMYLQVVQASPVIMKWTKDAVTDTNFVIIEGIENIKSLREGADDQIYYLKKGRGESTNIYRFPKTGGTIETYQSSLTGVFNSFDYDVNGNMILGGRNAIGVMNPDFTLNSFDFYQDYEIKSVKVFSGYVYVLAGYTGDDEANNSSGVYRNEILDANGQLGVKELIKDWNDTGEYQSAIFNALCMDEDGYIYIVTDHDDPLMRISPTGDVSSMYFGVLDPVMDDIIWGGGQYLYILENVGQVPSLGGGMRRIDMSKNSAPYFGRNL